MLSVLAVAKGIVEMRDRIILQNLIRIRRFTGFQDNLNILKFSKSWSKSGATPRRRQAQGNAHQDIQNYPNQSLKTILTDY